MNILHFFGFTVTATRDSHHADFVIYDHDQPAIEDWSDEVFAHGFVKWDGCSNWQIDAQDHVMLHGCSRDDLFRIGAILAACWDWAAELMPEHAYMFEG